MKNFIKTFVHLYICLYTFIITVEKVNITSLYIKLELFIIGASTIYSHVRNITG